MVQEVCKRRKLLKRGFRLVHRRSKMATVTEQPRCKACGSAYVYVRVSGVVICRRCGNVGAKPKVKR